MPTNVGYEYVEAERDYFDAKTDEQKIAALESMLATVPKHKGTEALQNQLKQRIAKLKKSSEKAKKAGRGKSLAIRKEGVAQVVLVGLPNSGKSTVLSELSGEDVEIADYPFTTKRPEVRMIPYENIWLQGIEIPAIYEGFSENLKSGVLISLIRNADFIMLIVDGSNKPQEALDSLIKELGKARVKLDKAIVVYTRQIAHLKIKFDQFYYLNKEQIAGTIWSRMGKIRVQTKTHGKTAEKPVILRKGATVKDLAETIHKDFIRKFKHAKIWGISSKFSNGQVVGLSHILRDGDRVEIFLK